ncbi:MAG: hypothetical protein J6W08_01725 [Alphaproteobacteria bacterium]|nr:hypothetical protein [Alphaproteobacteria bacterium]
MDKELGQKIDKDFDLYVEDFLTRDKNKGLKPSSLTPQEWQKLGESLAQKGVGLVSVEYNGREYYKFVRLNTQEPVKQEVDLHAKIDKNFDKYLEDFLQTEKNRGFKQSLLTEQEWQKLNDELASSNIVMVPITYNGYDLYKFAKLDKAAPEKNKAPELNKKEPQNTNNEAERAAEAKRQAEQAAEAKRQAEEDRFFQYKYPEFKRYGNEGFFVSKQGIDKSSLYIIEDRLYNDGYFAKLVPTKGVSVGEEYILVAIKREIAEKKFEFDGKYLKRRMDNSKFLKNIQTYKGKEITRIGNTPVFLCEVGSHGSRGMVTVGIGDARWTLPFYVSSGMAGKTNVPTGKWEVFWGIGPGKHGWFNKGSEREILNHYGSAQLKQIAEALDEKLGDPRDTELVIETVGRNSIGGKGIVAEVDNLEYIPKSLINIGLLQREPQDWYGPNVVENINYAVNYLRKLANENSNGVQEEKTKETQDDRMEDVRSRISPDFNQKLQKFLAIRDTWSPVKDYPEFVFSNPQINTEELKELNEQLAKYGVEIGVGAIYQYLNEEPRIYLYLKKVYSQEEIAEIRARAEQREQKQTSTQRLIAGAQKAKNLKDRAIGKLKNFFGRDDTQNS